MPAPTAPFGIDDGKSFDANLLAFIDSLAADDPALAEVLRSELPRLLRGEIEFASLWDALKTAVSGSASS
jgi:hypothetical protein